MATEYKVNFQDHGASFTLAPNANWSVRYHGGASLIREFSFNSERPDSFFHKFSVLGYKSGKIAISLTYSDTASKVQEQFEALIFDSKIPKNSVYCANTNGIKQVFEFFIEFNKLPEENLPLVRKLIENSDWQQVTPLTADDSASLTAQKSAYEESLNPKTWTDWILRKLFSNVFCYYPRQLERC